MSTEQNVSMSLYLFCSYNQYTFYEHGFARVIFEKCKNLNFWDWALHFSFEAFEHFNFKHLPCSGIDKHN